jgi:hypothetical protein
MLIRAVAMSVLLVSVGACTPTRHSDVAAVPTQDRTAPLPLRHPLHGEEIEYLTRLCAALASRDVEYLGAIVGSDTKMLYRHSLSKRDRPDEEVEPESAARLMSLLKYRFYVHFPGNLWVNPVTGRFPSQSEHMSQTRQAKVTFWCEPYDTRVIVHACWWANREGKPLQALTVHEENFRDP